LRPLLPEKGHLHHLGGVQVCNQKTKGTAGKGKRGLKRAWVEESEAETEGVGLVKWAF